jgi:hypothetical protein
MFRSKNVIQKPSRACAQQLTEVSSQSDEWYRNAYGKNIQTFIFIEEEDTFDDMPPTEFKHKRSQLLEVEGLIVLQSHGSLYILQETKIEKWLQN